MRHLARGPWWLPVAAGLLLACGASDREGPDLDDLTIAKPSANSGDAQVGVAGARLPDSLRVVVTRDGNPVEDVTVLWSTSEGSVAPAEVRTGPDGRAATTWTPLRLFAEQFASARIDREGGDVVGFTAIATPDPAAPNTVLVAGQGGDRFEPAEITIATGGTIDWFWPPGSAGHNIVPDDGDSPPHSGAPSAWPTWHVFRFTTPGIYRYHCATHGSPGGLGMSGTVTVVAPIPE